MSVLCQYTVDLVSCFVCIFGIFLNLFITCFRFVVSRYVNEESCIRFCAAEILYFLSYFLVFIDMLHHLCSVSGGPDVDFMFYMHFRCKLFYLCHSLY